MNVITQALPPLPGEHIEAVELDLTTRDGRKVVVSGRVSIWEGTRRMFVEASACLREVDRFTASELLQNAIRDRLIGSDKVRSAVDRGFEVSGLSGGAS